MTDGGPVIYQQTRLTKNGKKFQIYKFRTMVQNAEADGKARLASEGDPRILPIGRVLRATRLDELPQIYNILKGDMSIVGPRPERPELAAELEKEIPEFSFRLQVKAGLTGYAQVYGKYNTTPYDKLKLDLTYIRNYSVLEDLKLIIMTPKIMLMKESTEGVKEEQHNGIKSYKQEIRHGKTTRYTHFYACHKPTYVPENPIFYPVQVGTALTEKRLEHMAYRDNEGDNISGKKVRITVN